ncbi:MAG: hypothetical protein P4M04_11940 [Acidobacteriota bacterium]|nr:hypothetical protein [Acidobacteriota bacterium]
MSFSYKFGLLNCGKRFNLPADAGVESVRSTYAVEQDRTYFIILLSQNAGIWRRSRAAQSLEPVAEN